VGRDVLFSFQKPITHGVPFFCHDKLEREQIIKKGLTPFSEEFLDCFRSSGFDCGADWKNRPDFMHMQLAKI
jgi:hypothetical protein